MKTGPDLVLIRLNLICLTLISAQSDSAPALAGI